MKKYDALNFINRVHEYLDNALTDQESSQFIKDIHQDPSLLTILNNERNIRIAMKNKLGRKKVGEDFINSIRGRLYSD